MHHPSNFGGGEGSLSQSRCDFGGMSKQSAGLFLCRFLPCIAWRSLLFLVRLPILPNKKIKRMMQKCTILLILVEARGVEPLSENLFLPASPSADALLSFPRSTAENQAVKSGSLWCMVALKAWGHARSLLSDALAGPQYSRVGRQPN